MMQTFRAKSLRRQLLLAILLLVVPVLAAVSWSGFVTYRERASDLRDQAKVLSQTTAALVNRELTVIDRMATAFSGLQFVQAMNPVPSTDLFRRILTVRPNILDILLVRLDGTIAVRASTRPPFDTGFDWVRDAVAANRRIIVPLKAPIGPSQHVILAYPVKDQEGQPAGALACVVSLQQLQQALAALPLPPDAVVTVSDEKSRVLARSRDPELHVGQLLHPGQQSLDDLQNEEERTGRDGIRRVFGDSIAHEGPWLVSVGIPSSIAWDKAMSLWSRIVVVLVLGIAGWLGVALVMTRRLADTVSHLDATAKRIAAGDFSPMERKPMISREFEDLQQAFDAMLQQFNKTRAALDAQMSEERRIRQELQSLQGQVIRQERLAAVGQLVSGVAHEINNPLQAILGFSELLQMQPNLPEDAKSDLRLIQKESSRACGIIRNLALFARQQPGEAAPVRMGEVIRSVAELRQRRLQSEDIELRIEDQATQPVMAVVTELQQVVLNFVVNAEQSIISSGRQPGRITIRAYDKGDRVVLEAEDTGPGVPAEHEAKLFEPFFTTKPVGQGTGLGLSVSYGIIDSLRGQIGYRRAAAGGSIFYFELPAAMHAE